MRPRNREITIFNISMLDVICGAVGAFLILMIILFPSYQKVTGDTDQRVEQQNYQLRAELRKLESRVPLNKTEIEKRRRELEESTASVKRELSRIEPVQKQQKQASGQGLISLFASWVLPMNTDKTQDEFNAFLVPIENNRVGEIIRKNDAQVCEQLRRPTAPGRVQAGHVSTHFGLNNTIVLHRAVSQVFAIYYCKWKSKIPGLARYAQISGHINYGNKVWELPTVTVVDGGKLLGIVRLLDDNRLQIVEADELRGTAEKRRQEYQAQRRKSMEQREQQIRELETRKDKGKLAPEEEHLLEALKAITAQERKADRSSTVKTRVKGKTESAPGKSP
jgi:hypothetical protein